ncbi:MAG: hypothetical protein MJ248_00485 [Bacilli bacterium]|nr:hypothetical protein [Bacilli bacterium]
MNKIVKNLLLVTSAALLITGCKNKSSQNTDTSSNTDTTIPEPEEEKYRVSVTVPSGVKYELSHEYAKEGEVVTLTITEVGAGISISSVTMNNSELTATAANVYSFTMPSRSARIVIKLSISGDVVVEGDIAALLTKDPVTGIYCAKNVKVEGAGETSKFNFAISASGEKTTLSVMDFDETRSFGNVEICRDKEYALEVANGYTYDFYYNPEAYETPCYIQRANVDVLPSDPESLADLLIVTPSVRSEYAIYPTNLVGAHYRITDKTTKDVITKEMDYKLYENNVSFTKVVDTFDPDNVDPMYVYKKYDEANQLYTVVDTYKKYEGDKLSNDDRYRLEYNGNTAHSARLSVIQGDDWGQRYGINERYARRNVRTFAHMPNYFLEREMMYAYRVGFGGDNGMANHDISVVSTETATGFDVALNTTAEFTKNAGAEKDLTYKYAVNMSFTKAGAMTEVSFKQSSFNDKEWDFTAHSPKTGVKGTVVKSITGTLEYGNVKSGAPDMGDFNPNDYFIQEFKDVQFWNPKVDNQAAKDAGRSIVGLTDDLYFVSSDGEYSNLVANKKCYLPETALDLWQYGITDSTNQNVIRKEANDIYNTVSAAAVGKSTVTVTNHVPGTGASTSLEIEVIATSQVRDFWMSAIDTECYAVKATVKAGETYSFNIHTSPKDAALLYTAVSMNTSLLTIASAPNSPVLTIDTSGAIGITETTDVKVRIDATYGSYVSSVDGSTYTYGPTYFTFTLLPADVDPTGKWNAVDPNMPETYINFTKEVYDAAKGTYKGVISDTYYEKGVNKGTDRFYFEYSFKNGSVHARLYDVDIETATGSFSANDFFLDFAYEASRDWYLVFLAEYEYDTDYEDYWYNCILGDMGADGVTQGTSLDAARYAPFARAK